VFRQCSLSRFVVVSGYAKLIFFCGFLEQFWRKCLDCREFLVVVHETSIQPSLRARCRTAVRLRLTITRRYPAVIDARSTILTGPSYHWSIGFYTTSTTDTRGSRSSSVAVRAIVDVDTRLAGPSSVGMDLEFSIVTFPRNYNVSFLYRHHISYVLCRASSYQTNVFTVGF
jgi:hypothetical protein